MLYPLSYGRQRAGCPMPYRLAAGATLSHPPRRALEEPTTFILAADKG